MVGFFAYRRAAWFERRFLGMAVIAAALAFSSSRALARQTTPSTSGAKARANAGNGKTVYAAQGCAGCHGVNGEGGTGAASGPALAPPHWELAQFIDTIRNPKSPMPPYSSTQASDAQLADVFAYLKSVAPAGPAASVVAPAGNPENGKQLFTADGCYECHDNEGEGGVGTGPRLAPNPIAYPAFVQEIRHPSDIMPPYTAKVVSDAQLADIYAYLKSIPKAPSASTIPLLQ